MQCRLVVSLKGGLGNPRWQEPSLGAKHASFPAEEIKNCSSFKRDRRTSLRRWFPLRIPHLPRPKVLPEQNSRKAHSTLTLVHLHITPDSRVLSTPLAHQQTGAITVVRIYRVTHERHPPAGGSPLVLVAVRVAAERPVAGKCRLFELAGDPIVSQRLEGPPDHCATRRDRDK